MTRHAAFFDSPPWCIAGLVASGTKECVLQAPRPSGLLLEHHQSTKTGSKGSESKPLARSAKVATSNDKPQVKATLKRVSAADTTSSSEDEEETSASLFDLLSAPAPSSNWKERFEAAQVRDAGRSPLSAYAVRLAAARATARPLIGLMPD